MLNNKKILACIPARAGSKGLPGKNILPLAGKPLLAWSIDAARRSRYVDRIVVSTDGEEIAEIARSHGADVPFLRPAELATDTATTIDAVLYTVEQLATSGERYDYVALLEPTSPLRKADDIDRAIETLVNDPDSDALVTLGVVHLEHPRIVKTVADGRVVSYTELPGVRQRQETDTAYFPYGVLYLAKVSALQRERTFYPERLIPFFIERWQNYEIDDAIDFDIVERLMKKYYGRPFMAI